MLGIMADVLTKLKIGMPNLNSVLYRQDNAGCYHCASIIVGAKVLADKAGVSLKRLDFLIHKVERALVTEKRRPLNPTCKSSSMQEMTLKLLLK